MPTDILWWAQEAAFRRVSFPLHEIRSSEKLKRKRIEQKHSGYDTP